LKHDSRDQLPIDPINAERSARRKLTASQLRTIVTVFSSAPAEPSLAPLKTGLLPQYTSRRMLQQVQMVPFGAISCRGRESSTDTNQTSHIDPRSHSPIRTQPFAQRENCDAPSASKNASTFSADVHCL
jgi:hypothetical protein